MRFGPRRRSGAPLLLLWVLSLALVGCSRPVRPANVLLVTIDTLRADRVGCYGDRAAATPTIDALCAEGARFERAYTPAPLTLPAHATILTGQDPPRHGVRSNGVYVLAPEHVTLAETMRDAGYETAAFVGAFPLDRRFGLAQGFQTYDDSGMQSAGGFHYAERPAGAVVDSVLRWFGNRKPDVPFFVWVHMYDPHDPYTPPEPWGSRFMHDRYRGEVAYVDSQVSRLFEALKAADVWDRTLVALTADHGESLGEHGEDTHGFFVYDAALRVPLIVKPPSGRQLGPRRGLARLSDITPTVLDLVDRRGDQPVSGESLARGASTTDAYAESLLPQLDYNWAPLFSWREGRWKYIAAPRAELYDLEMDPGERVNLSDRERDRAASLARSLASAMRRGVAGAAGAAAPDPDAAARLASLGYASGTAAGEFSSGRDPKDMLPVAKRIDEIAAAGFSSADAMAALRTLAAADPQNNLLHRRLAAAYAVSGDPARAAEEYEAAIRAGYRGTDILAAAGREWAKAAAAADSAGRVQSAGVAIARAIARAPDEPLVIETHATWLARRGKPDEAVQELVRLTTREPARWTAFYQAGLIALDAGRPGEAAAALERARSVSPNADVLFALAEAYRQAGDSRAEGTWRAFLASAAPGDPRRDVLRQ